MIPNVLLPSTPGVSTPDCFYSVPLGRCIFYPRDENTVNISTFTQVLIAALFVTARIGNHPNVCQLANG